MVVARTLHPGGCSVTIEGLQGTEETIQDVEEPVEEPFEEGAEEVDEELSEDPGMDDDY